MLTVNLAQSRMTWESNLNFKKILSRSNLPLDMSVENYIDYLSDALWCITLWAEESGLFKRRESKANTKMHAFIHCSLSTPARGCNITAYLKVLSH